MAEGVRLRRYELDDDPDDDALLSRLGGVRTARVGIGKCIG